MGRWGGHKLGLLPATSYCLGPYLWHPHLIVWSGMLGGQTDRQTVCWADWKLPVHGYQQHMNVLRVFAAVKVAYASDRGGAGRGFHT